jgi:hypothetical protein
MSREIPESDWKKLGALKPLVLQRFCERTLLAIKAQLHEEEVLNDAHKTYLEIYKYIHEEDRVLSLLFDDWRRSTVRMTLMGWLRAGLLTESEFNTLSEETKSSIPHHIDIKFYPMT